jgi:hypothetical protein
MAAAALKGWNAPALVASVNIDAKSQTVIGTANARITELTGSPTELSWTELDEALPLNLDDKNISNHFLRQISDIDRELDQEPLTVQNLAPGSYQLTIDQTIVGTFSAEDFAKGIHLADFNTPMRGQAYVVGWAIRDRNIAHFTRLRMLNNERNFHQPAEPGATNLLTYESQMDQHIYDLAQPKPRHFQIQFQNQPATNTP